MIGHTCARAFANIHTDIEPLRLCRVAQKRLRMHDQIPKLNDFIVTKRRKLCRFAIRHRHEMTDRVRITIHHQEGILSPRDDKMRGVIARLSSRFKKIPVARFLFEILDPPRSPERFQLFLRKFFRGHAPMKLKSCSPKSSQHLPREISSQPRLNVSLTPRCLQILLALRCIALVETTLPIYELKRSTLLSRRNQPLIMRLHPRWQIPRQTN